MDGQFQFVTRMCWKREIQRVTYGQGKIEVRNYERRCIEVERLEEDFESRRASAAVGHEMTPMILNGSSGTDNHIWTSGRQF